MLIFFTFVGIKVIRITKTVHLWDTDAITLPPMAFYLNETKPNQKKTIV